MHAFEGRLFAWHDDRPDSWVFVTLPPELSDEIEESLTGPPRGFGSVRVAVTCGASKWSTSLFPSKEAGAYVLPVKKSVRKAEGGLAAGDTARFAVEVLD